VEQVDSGPFGEGQSPHLDGTRLSRWAAIVVLGGAGAVLVSWLAGGPALRQALSHSMKANTALCLTLLAAALLFGCRPEGRGDPATRVLSLVASALAAATMFEYLAAVDLYLDELVVRDVPDPEGSLHPGPMSPIAAFGLLVLGCALSLFPSRRTIPRAIAGVLALIGALVGFVAVFGYLYGASSLYKLGPAIRISEYTAAAMLLVAAGALSLWPRGTFARIFVRRTAGGVVMRRLFFPVVLTPTVLGLLKQAAQREGMDESLATALQAAGAVVVLGAIAWYLSGLVDRMDAQKTGALEENQRLARTAQGALKLRDDFIGMAAHELRTPLTSLRLQMQLWQNGISAEKGKEFSPLVQRQADRLVGLVESMLDGAALASGQMSLELQPVELGELVRAGIERLSPQLLASGTPVETRLDSRVEVYGDPRRLAQLVETLLANACKYGAGKPIAVELSQPDGKARLVVRDQGIGIEAKDQTRIFDAFERAVSPTNYPGLGLGLYLARQIAEAHGGRIDVQSGAGSGSVFTVSLPAGPSPATAL
jgi:signal transduction histidine kinase